jgi:hypothetical protein
VGGLVVINLDEALLDICSGALEVCHLCVQTAAGAAPLMSQQGSVIMVLRATRGYHAALELLFFEPPHTAAGLGFIGNIWGNLTHG